MSNKLNDFINERTEGDLVMLCNEIYDWNATKNLSEDSYIYGISRDFSCSPNNVKELVLDRSVEKLGKIVPLLLGERASKFLKDM